MVLAQMRQVLVVAYAPGSTRGRSCPKQIPTFQHIITKIHHHPPPLRLVNITNNSSHSPPPSKTEEEEQQASIACKENRSPL